MDAYLLNIYFIDDHTHIPTSYEAWQSALAVQRQQLDVGDETYQTFVMDVFVPVADLA
jgi:hypothetical protein